jgi:hypothetical protein
MCTTTTAVVRDDRRKPPRADLSVAGNTAPVWRRRWEPVSNYGYFELGRDLYRVSLQDGDKVCETWHVAKVVNGECALPYTVTLPVGGSGFVASCDCPSETYRKDKALHCKHVSSLVAALELLEVHEIKDDAVEAAEFADRLAKCGRPF